jgi:hypothetical protein
MVVNRRAVEVKLLVGGIGVELFRILMEKLLLAVVKRKLVVQGVRFCNLFKRKLCAGRCAKAAGAGVGEGGAIPFLIKKGEWRSQPCGVSSWREHERGAPLSRRPHVVFAKRRGDGVRGRGGASSSARRGPSEKSELVVRCEASLKRGCFKAGEEFGIPEAMPTQLGGAVRGWGENVPLSTN